ncbi:MAG: ATP-binding protein [Ancrocorticia sp.]|uniref:sensor histidine kinase n=1 Tax=Ancrocorticia sp. TaxID=2593684 RepID=UPI003F91FB1E
MQPLLQPKRTNTLSFRLLFTFIALIVVVIIVVSTITVTLLERYLVRNLDDGLRSSGKLVAVQIIDDMRATESGSGSNLNLSDFYLKAMIYDQQGGEFVTSTRIAPQTLSSYGTPSEATELLSTVGDSPQTVAGTKEGSNWRVIVLPVTMSDLANQNQPVGAVLVARPLAQVHNTVALVTRLLVLVGFAVLAVGTLVASWLVRHHLKSLRDIERATHSIAAGDLSQRVPEDNPGSEVGMLANSINVMLAQIEHAFADKERSERQMRQFVSDASHELRTPLATVRGYAELYRLGGVPDDQMTPTMARIESESKRMSRLVEDLLQLARLDEGRPLDRTMVNLNHACINAISDMHARDSSRNAQLIGLEGGAAPEVSIIGDKDKITQVITNILNNVLTHTPAGTPTELAIGKISPTEAVIEVRDHGPGVSAADAQHLFERFYRTDSSRSRESGGSGLGMSIVASIMAAHGGTARVQPTADHGLTVRLAFPIGFVDDDASGLGDGADSGAPAEGGSSSRGSSSRGSSSRGGSSKDSSSKGERASKGEKGGKGFKGVKGVKGIRGSRGGAKKS